MVREEGVTSPAFLQLTFSKILKDDKYVDFLLLVIK
jgi:hypothetical protein